MISAMCLALNIYFEARNQPLVGQILVAQVTMNRVESDSYPDTICKVVWQKRQFSWTHDGKSDTPKNKPVFDGIYKLSELLLKHPETFVYESVTHYHAYTVEPYWAKDFTFLYKYGDHLFYADDP